MVVVANVVGGPLQSTLSYSEIATVNVLEPVQGQSAWVTPIMVETNTAKITNIPSMK